MRKKILKGFFGISSVGAILLSGNIELMANPVKQQEAFRCVGASGRSHQRDIVINYSVHRASIYHLAPTKLVCNVLDRRIKQYKYVIAIADDNPSATFNAKFYLDGKLVESFDFSTGEIREVILDVEGHNSIAVEHKRLRGPNGIFYYLEGTGPIY